MKTLDQILEGVTAGGQWEAYTQTLSKGSAKGQKRLAGFKAGTPQRAVMHANWTLSEGDVWEAWITCKEPDYLYAQRACRNFPALVRALQVLHDETADYIRLNHLGDPHHNQSMKDARAVLAEALKD